MESGCRENPDGSDGYTLRISIPIVEVIGGTESTEALEKACEEALKRSGISEEAQTVIVTHRKQNG